MFQTEKNETCTYGITARGRAVASSEVETDRAALEVIVQWGEESILGVSHVEEAGSFTLGESGEGLDFCVPASVLGQPRLDLARLGDEGEVEVFIPPGARASLFIGGAIQSLPEPPPLPGISTAGAPPLRVVRIPEGATARVEVGDFVFLVKGVRAGKKTEAGFDVERRPLAYFAAVAGFTAVLLGAFSLMPPSSAALSVQNVQTGHRLVEYMIESQEVAQTPPRRVPSDDGGAGGPEAAASQEPGGGDPGDSSAERSSGSRAVRGQPSNRDRMPAGDPSGRVGDTAVLRVLATLTATMPSAPGSPFSPARAIGPDAHDALSLLMGGPVQSSQGLDPFARMQGPRLVGGPFDSRTTYRSGPFATRGGTADEGGSGVGPGRPMREHRSHSPRVVREQPESSAGLSRNAIQRVVRRHVNEVRFCYEQGLQSRPDLEGRIVTRFMIGPNGSVQAAMTMPNSTLRNARVEGCVTETVRRWAFPRTESGLPVTVTYPFSFRAN